MKIVVQNKVIETRDIVSIESIEWGFKVFLSNGNVLKFSEEQEYFDYEEAIRIWRTRMNEVIELWKQDKNDYPTVSWRLNNIEIVNEYTLNKEKKYTKKEVEKLCTDAYAAGFNRVTNYEEWKKNI